MLYAESVGDAHPTRDVGWLEMSDDIDAVLEEVLVDAYGDDEWP